MTAVITMKMDGRTVESPAGTTLLEAAAAAGIVIPTLCHLKGVSPRTSCMVCLVKDCLGNRYVPACSMPVAEGMVVETASGEVLEQRRRILDLILGEHAGDCDAPCQVTCPAGLDVPLMIRLLGEGHLDEAQELVRASIALPGITGHICPAPCEKGCRRGRLDGAIAIRRLEEYASRRIPALKPAPSKGVPVAIVGAGPAGLSAAYFLALKGYRCTVFDEHEQPGGQLRYRCSHALLPLEVLERDVEQVRLLGVEFKMSCRIDEARGVAQLKQRYAAVVLAPGRFSAPSLSVWGVAHSARGLEVDPLTCATAEARVFAGGEVVHAGKMAVRAMLHGRLIATGIDQTVSGGAVSGEPRRYNSRLGRLDEAELAEVKRCSIPGAPVAESVLLDGGAVAQEARRCLHCDCRRADDCRLRELAETCRTGTLPPGTRSPLRYVDSHPEVVYEPGKCILCGICVELSLRAGGGAGLAFTKRGFDARVAVPFEESLERALGSMNEECVRACPTGALAWKSSDRSRK